MRKERTRAALAHNACGMPKDREPEGGWAEGWGGLARERDAEGEDLLFRSSFSFSFSFSFFNRLCACATRACVLSSPSGVTGYH
jgi:hypothetical protein